LSEAEIQLKYAQEKKMEYEAELERVKQLLEQNRFKHDSERKEAERYQQETEERFKMW
jgi:cell division septum initiation protein DivIVA|tara:strand:- start:235 stop:408 length:174 start_codon:yes stop_codon:yes gene_type:complete